MARIFHQNMWNYVGGHRKTKSSKPLTRDQLFDRELTAIRTKTVPDYIVAGFTEVLNDKKAAAGIAGRALVLDPGLTRCIHIAVGITVLGRRKEFISIAWDPKFFTVRNAGQVLFDGQQWTCFNTAPVPATLTTILLPGEYKEKQQDDGPPTKKPKVEYKLSADSRGVAYIHGKYRNADRIVAFMHNMHSVGEPTSAYSNLDSMMSRIHDEIGLLRPRDYVGGDFNVNPRKPGRGELDEVVATQVDQNGITSWIKTTKWHTYDYWVTNQGPNQLKNYLGPDNQRPAEFARIDNSAAEVHLETLTSRASDHAAVALKLPY